MKKHRIIITCLVLSYLLSYACSSKCNLKFHINLFDFNKKKIRKINARVMPMNKDQEEFFNKLTEVEIETKSKTILSLCEAIRDLDLYESERGLCRSFLEWAGNQNGTIQTGINGLDRTTPIETDQTKAQEENASEYVPICPERYNVTLQIKTSRIMFFKDISEIIKESITKGDAKIISCEIIEDPQSPPEGKSVHFGRCHCCGSNKPIDHKCRG